jgi:hypothetical protein
VPLLALACGAEGSAATLGQQQAIANSEKNAQTAAVWGAVQPPDGAADATIKPAYCQIGAD